MIERIASLVARIENLREQIYWLSSQREKTEGPIEGEKKKLPKSNCGRRQEEPAILISTTPALYVLYLGSFV